MKRGLFYGVIRAFLVIGVLVPVIAALGITFRWGPEILSAENESPDWIGALHDLEMRDDLAQIYACMRERAEEQMVTPLERGSLPDQRLISAVNKAAADWEETSKTAGGFMDAGAR